MKTSNWFKNHDVEVVAGVVSVVATLFLLFVVPRL